MGQRRQRLEGCDYKPRDADSHQGLGQELILPWSLQREFDSLWPCETDGGLPASGTMRKWIHVVLRHLVSGDLLQQLQGTKQIHCLCPVGLSLVNVEVSAGAVEWAHHPPPAPDMNCEQRKNRSQDSWSLFTLAGDCQFFTLLWLSWAACFLFFSWDWFFNFCLSPMSISVFL